MLEKIEIEIEVNGKNYKKKLNRNELLIDFLRDKLGLTGVKEACGEGECGSCTVLLDNKPVNSCLTLAPDVDGESIVTVEGLEDDPIGKELQDAFVEVGAIQCGFCMPGMILASTALLKQKPKPEKSEIKKTLSNNLCRCTGYKKIIEAIKLASERLEGE